MLFLKGEFMNGLRAERAKLRLAGQLRDLRHEHGWSQRETAKRAGVAWRDVWRIENCYWTHITIKILVAITHAFGMGFDVRFTNWWRTEGGGTP